MTALTLLCTLLSSSTMTICSEIASEGNMAIRLAGVISTYEHTVRDGLRRGMSARLLHKLRLERDHELRVIIEQIGPNRNDHNLEELETIAMCYEYLRDWENSLKFATKAYNKCRSSENVYAPLVRCLLNLNRVEEAEQVLTEGTEHFGPTSSVHQLWMPLYIKRSRNGDWRIARAHLCKWFDGQVKIMDRTPWISTITAGQVHKLLEAYIRSDEYDAGLKYLDGLRERTLETLDSLTDGTSPANDDEDVIITSGHFLLAHEILVITDDETRLRRVQLDWMDYLINRSRQSKNAEVILAETERMAIAIKRKPMTTSAAIEDAIKEIRENYRDK